MNREIRTDFSDNMAIKEAAKGPIGLAMFLARAEGGTVLSKIPDICCTDCPYISKSFHESSLHARYHP